MPSYRVFIKPGAEREMNSLSEPVHRRITAKILGLAENPRPHGTTKLHGMQGYRLRVGDYRVLYTIEDASSTVTVQSVAHRREAYR